MRSQREPITSLARLEGLCGYLASGMAKHRSGGSLQFASAAATMHPVTLPKTLYLRPLTSLAILAVSLGVALSACSSGGGETPSASGSVLYAANCARCHGSQGEGIIGPSLAGVAQTFPEEDGQIAFVSNGGGGMPRFSDLLSEADIKAIVEYTRSTFK